MISTTAMIIAVLDRSGLAAPPAIGIAVLFATGLGLLMGLMIQYFEAPPFIVTLAGMFFARGLGYILSLSSIPVKGPFYHVMSTAGLRFEGGAKLTVPAMVFLFMGLLLFLLFLLQKAFVAGTKLGKERA